MKKIAKVILVIQSIFIIYCIASYIEVINKNLEPSPQYSSVNLFTHMTHDTTEEITEQTTDNYCIETTTEPSIGLFKVYGYCPCVECCGKTDGITATGTQATANNTIAVDPEVIPYGTKVMIDGNIYTAEDCVGGIKGNTIDLFFNTHEEAQEWGVKYLEVYRG